MEYNNSFTTRTWSNPPSLAQSQFSTASGSSSTSLNGLKHSNTLSANLEATDPCRIGRDPHPSRKRAHDQDSRDRSQPAERSGKRIRREETFDFDLAKALLFQPPIHRAAPRPEKQSTFSFSRAWQVTKNFFTSSSAPRTPLRSSGTFQRSGGPSSPHRSPSKYQEQRARWRRARSQRSTTQLVDTPIESMIPQFDPIIETSASSLSLDSKPLPPAPSSSTVEPLSLYTFPALNTYVIVRHPDSSLLGLRPDPAWPVETKHAFNKAQSGLKTSACVRSKLALVGNEDSVDDSRWQWQDPVPRSLTRQITNRHKRDADHAILARKMAFFQERVDFFERNGNDAYMKQALAAGYSSRHWHILNEIPQMFEEPPMPEPEDEDAQMDFGDDDDYDYAQEEAEVDEWVRRISSKPPSPSRASQNPEYLSLTRGSTGLHRMERRISSRPSKRSERASTPPPDSLPASPTSSEIEAKIHQFGVPSPPRPNPFLISTPPRHGTPTLGQDPASPASPSSPFRALTIAEEDDPWTMVSPAEGSSTNGSSPSSSLLSSASRAWSAFATISSRPSLTNFLPNSSSIPASAIPSFFTTPRRSASSDSLSSTRSASSHHGFDSHDPTASPKRKRSLDEHELVAGAGSSSDSDAFKRRRR